MLHIFHSYSKIWWERNRDKTHTWSFPSSLEMSSLLAVSCLLRLFLSASSCFNCIGQEHRPSFLSSQVCMVLCQIGGEASTKWGSVSLISRPVPFVPSVCVHIIHRSGGPVLCSHVLLWTQTESKKEGSLGTKLRKYWSVTMATYMNMVTSAILKGMQKESRDFSQNFHYIKCCRMAIRPKGSSCYD